MTERTQNQTAKPKCVIVTGRQGSGKTTLARELGRRLWMPVISRDEIKEGYVNTFGRRHDELPPDTNRIVTDFFFEIVNQYLVANISVVIEAAFQHRVWEPRMPKILDLADARMVLCYADDEVTSHRPLQRGIQQADREFYHGDHRAVHYKKTGEILLPAPYEPPEFAIPTIRVATDEGYVPAIDEIVSHLRSDPGHSSRNPTDD